MHIGVAVFLAVVSGLTCEYGAVQDLEVVLVLDGNNLDDVEASLDWVYDVEEAVTKAGKSFELGVILSGSRDNSDCFKVVHEISTDLDSVLASLRDVNSLSSGSNSNLPNTLVYASSMFSESTESRKVMSVVGASGMMGVLKPVVMQPDLANGVMKCPSSYDPGKAQFALALEKISLLVLDHSHSQKLSMSVWFHLYYVTSLAYKSRYSDYVTSNTPDKLRENLALGILSFYCEKRLELTIYYDLTDAKFTVLDLEDTTAFLACSVPSGRFSSQTFINNRQNSAQCLTEASALSNDTTAATLAVRRAFEDYASNGPADNDHNAATLIPYLSNHIMCKGDQNTLCLLLFVGTSYQSWPSSDVTDFTDSELKCGQPLGSIQQIFGPLQTNRQDLMLFTERSSKNSASLLPFWKTQLQDYKMPARAFNGVWQEFGSVPVTLRTVNTDIASLVTSTVPAMPDRKVLFSWTVDRVEATGLDQWWMTYAAGSYASVCAHRVHDRDTVHVIDMVASTPDKQPTSLSHTSVISSSFFFGRPNKYEAVSTDNYVMASCPYMQQVLESALSLEKMSVSSPQNIQFIVTEGKPQFGNNLSFQDISSYDDGCPTAVLLKETWHMKEAGVIHLARSDVARAAWIDIFEKFQLPKYGSVQITDDTDKLAQAIRDAVRKFPENRQNLCPAASDQPIYHIVDSSGSREVQELGAIVAYLVETETELENHVIESRSILKDECVDKKSSITDFVQELKLPDNDDSDSAIILALAQTDKHAAVFHVTDKSLSDDDSQKVCSAPQPNQDHLASLTLMIGSDIEQSKPTTAHRWVETMRQMDIHGYSVYVGDQAAAINMVKHWLSPLCPNPDFNVPELPDDGDEDLFDTIQSSEFNSMDDDTISYMSLIIGGSVAGVLLITTLVCACWMAGGLAEMDLRMNNFHSFEHA